MKEPRDHDFIATVNGLEALRQLTEVASTIDSDILIEPSLPHKFLHDAQGFSKPTVCYR